MDTEALEKAKRDIFVDRRGFNAGSYTLTGYAIAMGLVAIAEQIGNVAKAIAATKKEQ